MLSSSWARSRRIQEKSCAPSVLIRSSRSGSLPALHGAWPCQPRCLRPCRVRRHHPAGITPRKTAVRPHHGAGREPAPPTRAPCMDPLVPRPEPVRSGRWSARGDRARARRWHAVPRVSRPRADVGVISWNLQDIHRSWGCARRQCGVRSWPGQSEHGVQWKQVENRRPPAGDSPIGTAHHHPPA